MTNPKILLAALLWLRNHYDCDGLHRNIKQKREVLARIDSILDENPFSLEYMKLFRLHYPYVEVKDKAASVEVIQPNWPPPRSPEQQKRVDDIVSGPAPDVDHDTWENEGGASK